MPDKKNKSKIKSILERGGLIRETVSEDSYETGINNPSFRNDTDIKPIFDVPDNAVKVTPAARQPIPGMINPVFPNTKDEEIEYERTGVTEVQEYERIINEEIEQPQYSAYDDDFDVDEAPDLPIASSPPSPPPPPSSPQPLPLPVVQEPATQQRSSSVFGSLNLFKNGSNSPEESPAPPMPPVREPQPENYTDRFLNTEELYDALALRSKKTDSIYLIEEYLKTLPDSLPDAQRRDIVNKLISASGFDYDLLMGDGVLRVKMLKEYAERFARHTDDYIAARQAELDELDQQILRTRRLIENRKDLHKKQFFSIEAEAQRLKEILTFISG